MFYCGIRRPISVPEEVVMSSYPSLLRHHDAVLEGRLVNPLSLIIRMDNNMKSNNITF